MLSNGHVPGFKDVIAAILLHTGDEEDALFRPPFIEGIVILGAVQRHDRTWTERDPGGRGPVMAAGVVDDREDG